MLYKFAQQLRAKLIELKTNKISELLTELNLSLLDKSSVHLIDEKSNDRNFNLIKQIKHLSESIVLDMDIGDFSLVEKRIKEIYIALKSLTNISIGSLVIQLKEILDLIKELKEL